MKKCILLLTVMIGLCFSLSEVNAQPSLQAEHSENGSIQIKPAGQQPKQNAVIVQDLKDKIEDLKNQVQQSSQNDLASKTIMIESLLYRGMLSDLISTEKTIASAYQENLEVFLIDYPEFGEYTEKKQDIVLEFYGLIFLD